MRVGITLPTFSADAAGVLRTAREAEEAGLDGVFVFDHLWPLRSPQRPSLTAYPVLGAVLAATDRIAAGTLVARLGLLPDEVVEASLTSLQAIGGGRLIAGLGTGDSSSSPENTATGIPFASAPARRERLARLAARFRDAGLETWIGAGSAGTNDIARRTGVTLNVWDATPEVVAAHTSEGQTVSWAGPLPKDGSAAAVLHALAEAGATWAVWGWPRSVELVASTLAESGIRPARGGM